MGSRVHVISGVLIHGRETAPRCRQMGGVHDRSRTVRMAESKDVADLMNKHRAIIDVVTGVNERRSHDNRRGITADHNCSAHRNVLIHSDYDMNRTTGREWLPLPIPLLEPNRWTVPGSECLLYEFRPGDGHWSKGAGHGGPNPVAEHYRFRQHPDLEVSYGRCTGGSASMKGHRNHEHYWQQGRHAVFHLQSS